MKHSLYLALFMIKSPLILGLASPTYAGELEVDKATAPSDTTKKIAKIVVVSHPIFDESAPDAFFIHHWANTLHINTREAVILDKLSFAEGEQTNQHKIEEAQRLLRAEPYLRDAVIRFAEKDPQSDVESEGEVIIVETWDNWSLLPTFSASRNGGESKFSFGIKEDNLLGYGIRTRLRYTSDEDRTGYKFAIQTPVSFVKHGEIGLNFYDNSDGQSTQVYFTKPFYTLDGNSEYGFSFSDTTQIDTLKQNGLEVNEFEHKFDYFNLSYGWRLDSQTSDVSRIRFGITKDQHKFDSVAEYPNSPLPQDRDFLYPWVSYQYIQDQYKVLQNIKLINFNEDYNLGWQHHVKLGLETQDSDNLGYHLDWQSSKGYFHNASLLLLDFNGQASINTKQADFFKVTAQAEYFYKISAKWSAYGKIRASTSQNNYLDKPFALGDETGLRGYPNDYQYGDHQWLTTAELRYYPNINLYQLAELGWAAFIDVGQASGGNDQNNEVSGVLGSVGIGARIYSSRSSYGHVAHIDLTVPFTSGQEVDSWEWRVLVKRSF